MRAPAHPRSRMTATSTLQRSLQLRNQRSRYARQPHFEAGSAAREVVRDDRAAVALDDLPRDRQPEPDVVPMRFVGAVGEEPREDAIQMGLRNPRTAVVEGDDRVCARLA